VGVEIGEIWIAWWQKVGRCGRLHGACMCSGSRLGKGAFVDRFA
jgi:hypothetical protein